MERTDRSLSHLWRVETTIIPIVSLVNLGRKQVLRRLRTVHNKAKENFEERGPEMLSVGCGLATWENKRAASAPSARVVLQRAALRPVGAAQDELELSLTGEMEVNPTPLHVLRADFGCEVDQRALAERIPDGRIDELRELQGIYRWICGQARRSPGFGVDERIVLANFAYAKLAMVSDLDVALDEPVANDLIAALAGDQEAGTHRAWTTARNCNGRNGAAAKARPAWTRTPRHATRHPVPRLHGRRRNCARRRQPREQGAARCPAPTPQTGTMAITQRQLPHNAESRL